MSSDVSLFFYQCTQLMLTTSTGPLSPFVAFWSAYQTIFTEGPNKSIEVSEETKLMVRKAIGLDCDNFYNIAVVGAAGTGKVSRTQQKRKRDTNKLTTRKNI